MSLILRYVIGRQANPPLASFPDLKLQQELKETQNQLNSILTEWNWSGQHPQTAQEFLNKFKPWVNQQIKDRETWNNTEQEYLKKIEELKVSKEIPEDQEELISERDQLARDKNELEQEVLSLNNKLKLKQQEVSNKEKSLENLKKEKQQTEKDLRELKTKYSKQGKLLDTEQLECKKLEENLEKVSQENEKLKEANQKLVNRLNKIAHE